MTPIPSESPLATPDCPAEGDDAPLSAEERRHAQLHRSHVMNGNKALWGRQTQNATGNDLDRARMSTTLPIRMEAVATELSAVQDSLLEQGASGISETILFYHQNRQQEENASRYRGLHRNGADYPRMPLQGMNAPRVIGVTSAVAGEGKTTVALHIALSLANNSFKKICLIELGLKEEVLCDRLGIPSPKHGVVDILEWGESGEPEFLPLPLLQFESYSNLFLFPAGRVPQRAEKTAHSPRMGDVLSVARGWSDIVVVDLPSIASGNALPICDYLDGIVVVVRSGITPKDIVNVALDRIGRNRVLGVVMNGQESSLPAWLSRRFGEAGM